MGLGGDSSYRLATIVFRLTGEHPRRVRLLQNSINDHWLVTLPSGIVVLRRYGISQNAASVEWEEGVTTALAGRGWAVPRVIAGPSTVGDQSWAVFARLPGRKLPATSARNRERGRLLALLHNDLETIQVPQRPGWTAHHVGAIALLHELDDLDRALTESGAAERFLAHPHLARTLHGFAEQTVRGLHSFGIDGQPTAVIHGDFLPWNLLYRGTTVTGILDFEKAHVDLPAADLSFATWGGRHEEEVVAGYATVRDVDDGLRRALPTLWDATCLGALHQYLLKRRAGLPASGLDWAIAHALRPWGD